MDSRLRSLVKKHTVGKSAQKHGESIICDIIAVHQGCKSGFLYDYGAITSPRLASLVSDIIKNLLPHNQEDKNNSYDLCVVGLGLDIMLVNCKALLLGLENQEELELENSNIVDISKNLKSPCRLSLASPQGIGVKQELHQLYIQCKETFSKKPADDKVMEMGIAETENLNLSTVFGLFIGYPVLYWFQGGAQASNCLDMVPLVVYQVTCDVYLGDHHTSTQNNQREFQTPSSACEDETRVKRNHILYSFSVPGGVIDSFEELINVWFQNLQGGCSSSLITNLQMNQKTVTLPTVAL